MPNQIWLQDRVRQSFLGNGPLNLNTKIDGKSNNRLCLKYTCTLVSNLVSGIDISRRWQISKLSVKVAINSIVLTVLKDFRCGYINFKSTVLYFL